LAFSGDVPLEATSGFRVEYDDEVPGLAVSGAWGLVGGAEDALQLIFRDRPTVFTASEG